MELSEAKRVYFLAELREARYATLEDGENFTDICAVLEEIGAFLIQRPAKKEKPPTGLGGYISTLVQLVDQELKSGFQQDLESLKDARNDKAHTGVYARNAAAKALSVGTLLEGMMAREIRTIRGFMVEGVIFATADMTLAKVREVMLSHSFSYLPYTDKNGKHHLLSDREVARAWRKEFEDGNSADRKWAEFKHKHQTSLSQLAETEKGMHLEEVTVLDFDAALAGIDIPEKPCLVAEEMGDKDNPRKSIVGIVSPFDWL